MTPEVAATATLDVAAVRAQFPILQTRVNGKPLVYLDSAASAQKPLAVIEAEARFYRESYANVHRGVHTLSQRATGAYEAARARVARFLGAPDPAQVVFTRSATEGLNLVAWCYARPRLAPGDAVLVTEMEHHSNIVPWQMVCEVTGAKLVVAPVDDRGELRLDELARLLTPGAGSRVKVVACVHVSNALGTINPIAEISRLAHDAGAAVVVDGAQAAPHLAIDVGALGCDFYTFSGHKVYGPTGIGALWGRPELLAEMPPWQGGGDMILHVSFAKTDYAPPPARFEAGTPHIVGAVGLAAALDWLESLGQEVVAAHEQELLAHATELLGAIPGVRLIGSARAKASVLSFLVAGVHAHDVGTILDAEGVAVRAGHHCAQPLMERFGVAATARASFAVYNTREEVETLAAAVAKAQELFA
ncbi:MAG TPA: cysteine desulfurase [Thermoanaerobaculia bacterium]|jgi:cysteine desulfurase/selenocysteine lyase|nr:cysteine desulfurase [Thermoanaerobaculia bacterium]